MFLDFCMQGAATRAPARVKGVIAGHPGDFGRFLTLVGTEGVAVEPTERFLSF